MINKFLLSEKIKKILEEEKEWNSLIMKKYVFTDPNLEDYLYVDVWINGY